MKKFGFVLFLSVFCFVKADFSSVPGSVINYIESPSRFFGVPINPVYISDPCITVLPNGDYITSHARFGGGSDADNSGKTSVFRSSDKGASWTHSATLNGILRASLFVHNGDLYLLGSYNSDGGQNVIRKSTDNGNTWTNADNSQTGLLGNQGIGSPNNPLVFNGRIWSGATRRLISAPTGADLLKASSWTMTNWASPNGHPLGDEWDGGWTEGQAVASAQTGVYILPKIRGLPHTARIKAKSPSKVKFNASAEDAFPHLPGGEKKFGASYDPVSGKFYVLSNPVLDVHKGEGTPPELVRTAGGLLSSEDLINWELQKIFIFTENLDNGSFGEGFQYFNFDFDGDDMVIASRTAFDVGGGDEKPPRGHDSNLMTFHKIENFRQASPEHFLVIDSANGDVLRFEKTQHQDAPLGSFTLGSTFEGQPLNNPEALAQDDNGDVYIRQQNGKILRFDALGNYIDSPASSPAAFQSGQLDISQPAEGEKAWTKSGSGNWEDLTNWYYWGRPENNSETANFGSAAGSPASVSLNKDYAIKSIRFNNDSGYTLQGPGSITFESDTYQSVIEVRRGSHEIAVPVWLNNHIDIIVENGAELHLTGEVDLNYKKLAVKGEGTVYIEDTFKMSSGTLELDGSAKLSFTQTSQTFITGRLYFNPHESLSLEPNASYELMEGVNHLSSEFYLEIMPVLPEGLSWDSSMLYSNGKAEISPDNSYLNFSHIAYWWLAEDCPNKQGCSYADFSRDGFVNTDDLIELAESWLE
ncbi:hypothetical protein L21SP3_02059 [Sedimentisphaera cyanobacteriorum]|uniref:Neuraminidase (Sialidase) n=1 Tax=Sedimentisphaera cyanobacteriorum TaxID=1940790 RepID=A0A1Q2HSC6_9BACT|nr:sialidase family protein [Sedimentisphaera cyanobacteriorum]AQQ10231.1 hypothetical protein L21SP3_02059 [Sedimentisphaera cyanobacteriorum]